MKEIQRNIHTIDAQGKVPGRLATQIVHLLLGKNKASFVSNVDAGDYVQVINASKMVMDPKKLIQKVYYHHTTFASGLKSKTQKQVFEKDPGDVLRRAVSRMLPKNKQRTPRLKRLVVKN
jgi:large subunit ribosomal protein L13